MEGIIRTVILQQIKWRNIDNNEQLKLHMFFTSQKRLCGSVPQLRTEVALLTECMLRTYTKVSKTRDNYCR